MHWPAETGGEETRPEHAAGEGSRKKSRKAQRDGVMSMCMCKRERQRQTFILMSSGARLK